jgi:hypothetical protein
VRCIPGSTTDLGEGEHDAPHLTLVAETIFADKLQFGVTVRTLEISDLNGARSRLVAMGDYAQTSSLEWTTRYFVRLGVAASVELSVRGWIMWRVG